MKMTSDRLDNAFSEMSKIQEELALHEVETTFKERKSKGKNVGKYRGTNDDTNDEEKTNQLYLLEKKKKNKL